MFVLGGEEPPFFKPMAKKLTPDFIKAKQKAVELLKQNIPSVQITFMTGIKRSALSDLRKKHNIDELGKGRKRVDKKKYEHQESSHYRFSGYVLRGDSFIENAF